MLNNAHEWINQACLVSFYKNSKHVTSKNFSYRCVIIYMNKLISQTIPKIFSYITRNIRQLL